jgi:hypothetical protein
MALAAATMLHGHGALAIEAQVPAAGAWSQAPPVAPAIWSPNWKHPGQGPIPTQGPLWQVIPANPNPPPGWGPGGGGNGPPPAWSPALPYRQGEPPLWSPL